ncbi:hypothetical protein CO172_01290 [Candidatus Uhrbacteria bacterium CG_4_9_14_3_um_filter_36_7]|uniref:Uncharacterized protein n=1 Tax=Candidatus Uhrbacteria bacterium CG_4_9_14_3_um_filter_36_7 TaxID=1975033 RepID=A0A2M7XIA1_9BACT|nr:MAG: hypothetical protein CO172_01290 [Candidatus Uhrbacteria bacterium CG_4_9_14_3_um_filter_36_7]
MSIFSKIIFICFLIFLLGSGCQAPNTNIQDQDQDRYSVSQGDCKDNDPSVYPSAPEIIDNKDNDCDGQVDETAGLGSEQAEDSVDEQSNDSENQAQQDEEQQTSSGNESSSSQDYGDYYDPTMDGWLVDIDGDGWFASEDCNDTDPDMHPYAQEIACNPVDENCDGVYAFPAGGDMIFGSEDYGMRITCGEYLRQCGRADLHNMVSFVKYYDGVPTNVSESCLVINGYIDAVYPPNY